jgi:hypothetical protein
LDGIVFAEKQTLSQKESFPSPNGFNPQTMHPQVKRLAAYIGVSLSDRICSSVEHGLPADFDYSHALYNGESIATRIRIEGKIWDRDDHSLLHEIAHYLVASPYQRDLLEFGLGTPAYGQPLNSTQSWGYPAIPSVVEEEESEIQEHMAQFLCVSWGQQFGISPRMLENPDYVGSWEDYFALKAHQEDDEFTARLPIGKQVNYLEQQRHRVWRALILLQNLSPII